MKLFDFFPLLLAPIWVQGLCMFFDEFYYHRKRGLPLWERIGHPLDTVTVLVCFAILIWLPPTPNHLLFYVGACLFSCIFVTKDEFVHHEHCTKGEVWLHSVLFVLHPIVFISAGVIWFFELPQQAKDQGQNIMIEKFLSVQFLIVLLFLMYQVVYWNFIYPNQSKEASHESSRN